MAEDTRAWLVKSLVTLVGADPHKITDDARLDADLGADSLDVLEIVMAAEDRFAIKVADDEIGDVATVRQALALIDGKVAAR